MVLLLLHLYCISLFFDSLGILLGIWLMVYYYLYIIIIHYDYVVDNYYSWNCGNFMVIFMYGNWI